MNIQIASNLIVLNKHNCKIISDIRLFHIHILKNQYSLSHSSHRKISFNVKTQEQSQIQHNKQHSFQVLLPKAQK